MSPFHRRGAAAALAVAGALLLPAAGQAAVTFGVSHTTNDPTATGCEQSPACTVVSYINPSNPNGDPDASGSPIDGVVTAFHIRAYSSGTPGTVTFRVADVSRPNPADTSTANADITATGPSLIIPVGNGADVPLSSVASRVPIRRGQHLAIDNPGNVSAVYSTSGDPFSYEFAPALVDGRAPLASTSVTNELLVSATVEPDADHDGFGDETQDLCPTDPSTHAACSSTTTTTPGTALTIRGLGVSHGLVRYRLSARTKVSLQFAKGSRCSSSGRCARFVKLGDAFVTTGKAGVNTAPLPRPHGHRLARGRYRVTVTARANGKLIRATVSFKV